jgi:alkyldihydroxyacetonephosphate synthase
MTHERLASVCLQFKSFRLHRVATRSSGIKQRSYGNIEGIVVKVKVVTSMGTFDKSLTPRASMGPEIESLIFGSEGTLGLITQAVIRVHKRPEVTKYGGVLFPTFQHGINFMRECSERKCLPTSLRLIDNYQVKFGLAVSYYSSIFQKLLEKFKLKLIDMIMDSDCFCIASYLIEGSGDRVEKMSQELLSIASKYGGWNAGPHAGERSYFITFTVGYMRVSSWFIYIYRNSNNLNFLYHRT